MMIPYVICFFFQHHCRQCGSVVCGDCSENRKLLNGQGNKKMRVCDVCMEEPTDRVESATEQKLTNNDDSSEEDNEEKVYFYVSRETAKYDFTPVNEDVSSMSRKLSFKSGQMLDIVKKDESGWWLGIIDDGEIGWVPGSYFEG
eukprot:TRINITY_DN2472_c0_g1_i5.p1 TRINITY_DN2472_c0_g1~~TRINITY_DN2472_c0_g1_i5.p1  ORF type:complete len:144 (+),score=31.40 TRINITY_DN2472_c0_g1_i5:275-706(+)